MEQEQEFKRLKKLALEHSKIFVDNSFVQKYESEFWCSLFFKDFIENSNSNDDDLLFFVKEQNQIEKKKGKEVEENYFVRRKDSKNLPMRRDLIIDWERTYYLNMVINRISYTLVVTIRKKINEDEEEKQDKKLKHKITTKVVKKVYSSPAEVRMDEKKTLNQFAYPKIYFSIHDFNETFKEIVISTNEELVGVELIAKGTIFTLQVKKHIFRGALSYDSIKQGYSKKKKSSWFKISDSEKFLQLKGPNGKGEAQMAVNSINSLNDLDNSNNNNLNNSNETNSSSSTNSSSPTNLNNNEKKESTTGKYINTALNWFRPNKQKQNEEENPVLNCFLTYINIEWDSIIKDFAEF